MRRVLTPRWVLVHGGVLTTVAGFLALGWWQVSRAIAGNILSFGYAFEWPVFAGFLIFVWTREIRSALAEPSCATEPTSSTEPATTAGSSAGRDRHGARDPHGMGDPHGTGDLLGTGGRRGAGGQRGTGYRRRTGPAYDDSGDESLAAYNHYLAWLNAHPHASPADYPG